MVVWLVWLQLVWCVIAEVSAAVRNIGMPRRVPLAGGIQALVHRLVTTALLVSTAAAAAPALAPAAALAATPPAAAALAPFRDAMPGSSIPGRSLPPSLLVAPAANGGAHRLLGPADVSQEFRPVNGSPGGNGTQATAASPDGGQDRWAHRTEKIYVVKPPVGRFHESLWEIAVNHLGDGRRYREIFELNKDLPQPDGSMLTIASLIRPGWVLRMPHDASGPGIEEVRASPPARHSGRPHQPRPAAHPPAPGSTPPLARRGAACAAVPPRRLLPGSPGPQRPRLAHTPPRRLRPPVSAAPAPPTALIPAGLPRPRHHRPTAAPAPGANGRGRAGSPPAPGSAIRPGPPGRNPRPPGPPPRPGSPRPPMPPRGRAGLPTGTAAGAARRGRPGLALERRRRGSARRSRLRRGGRAQPGRRGRSGALRLGRTRAPPACWTRGCVT